jgi:heme/copper-type cytochrome/quinol oxidase subunit 2
MQEDTIAYDTLNDRPLPKWLTDQKEGLTTVQPQKIEMKEDNSLQVSFVATASVILLTISVLTVFVLRKFRRRV